MTPVKNEIESRFTADERKLVATVRRQSFWDSERLHLREALARLFDDAMRPAADAASVGLRWSVV